MELQNIKSISVNGTNITNLVTKQEDLQTCDKSTSIATIAVLKKMILESIYPVGSVYINYSSTTSPKDKLGFGEWSRIQGKYIRAADTTTELKGGSDTITTDMIPVHWHTLNLTTSSDGAHTHTITVKEWWDSNDKGEGEHMIPHDQSWPDHHDVNTNWYMKPAGGHNHAIKGTTGSTGSGAKNLPSYKSFYIWYRTA